MRRILAAVAAVLSAQSLQAQSRFALGLDYSTVRSTLAIPRTASNTTFHPLTSHSGGLSLLASPTPAWSIEVGALLGMVGGAYPRDAAGRTPAAEVPVMQIPVLAHYRVLNSNRFSLHASAGASIVRAANGRVVDRDTDVKYEEFRTNGTTSNVVAGGEVRFKARFPLRLGIRYNHGLQDITKLEKDIKSRSWNAVVGARLLQW